MAAGAMASSGQERRQRIWAWILGFYAAGIVLDFLFHLYLAQQIGDRQISASDLAVSFAASLFWPADIVLRTMLSSL
jgi:uncharacterized membrane protein YhaH (DUF805 family)